MNKIVTTLLTASVMATGTIGAMALPTNAQTISSTASSSAHHFTRKSPTKGARPQGKRPAFGSLGKGQKTFTPPTPASLASNTNFVNSESQILGIAASDLQSRLTAGKTIQQIISDLGLTQTQLQTKMTAARTAQINAMVTAGKITAAQATTMIANLGKHPFPMFGMGMGRGGRIKPASTTSTK